MKHGRKDTPAVLCVRNALMVYAAASLPSLSVGFATVGPHKRAPTAAQATTDRRQFAGPSTGSICFDFEEELPDSTYTHVMQADCEVVANEIRRIYDDLFRDPREPNGARFVFDPWYVTCGDQGTKPLDGQGATSRPNYHGLSPASLTAANEQVQYSLKRAQLSQFLDDDRVYGDLVDTLTRLGRSIGCTCITPPWISMYLDGDQQNFHTDSPHGPIAFTLSITSTNDYGMKFHGGETMMLNPKMLDYWRNYDETVGLETPSILQFYPPLFGRCLAFDPRIPHGVNQVHGTKDPRHGRVVVHGWFSEPETIFIGDMFDEANGLRKVSLQQLDEMMQPLIDLLGSGDIGRVIGYLAIKVDIAWGGGVESLTCVCDTLVADPEDFRGSVGEDMEGREVLEDSVSDVKLTINESLKKLQLPEKASTGTIIVPFLFS